MKPRTGGKSKRRRLADKRRRAGDRARRAAATIMRRKRKANGDA